LHAMAGAHLPDDFTVAGPLGNSDGVVIARHISKDSIDDAARELGGFHILVSEGPAQPAPPPKHDSHRTRPAYEGIVDRHRCDRTRRMTRAPSHHAEK